ncbi:MAG TPA: DNA-processing protein DprA [Nitrososphaerales archaeon]
MKSKAEVISSFTPEQLLGMLNDVEKKHAPARLYAVGNLQQIPLPLPRVAIIGSRKASLEGLKTASDIARVLVKNNVIVVSGLAEGIDTAAHKTTIEEGGDTIAVLGTPLDRVYPQKNSHLQDIIKRQHLAISQFPVGQPIQPKNFVLRNRTMALISNASIIVEAGETSGSLHQGWESLRLGRPLFIYKSIVNDPSLNWPKKMMEYGAIELNEAKEVVDVLPSSKRILNMELHV